MKIPLLSLIIIILVSCAGNNINTTPEHYLTQEEIDAFKHEIIRYVDRLAPKSNHDTKFESKFDDYYKSKAEQLDLAFYHEKKDTIYFAVTKIAPSIKLKKVTTAGKLVRLNNGAIKYYEETFRTYKMEELPLLKKTELMFLDLIKGSNLSQYEYLNTKPEEYIEFPDENTFYDSDKKIWVSKLENPYEALKKSYQPKD